MPKREQPHSVLLLQQGAPMHSGQACCMHTHVPLLHMREFAHEPQFSQLPHPSVVSPHSVPCEPQVFAPQHWLW
jgi:hypothetical protein